MHMSPTSLAADYISHLSNERRLSPLTCKSYAGDIGMLLKYLQKNSLNQIQPHHIRHFIAQLRHHGLSGRSLARIISSWRGFYGYLIRSHNFTQNPCVGIHAPKSAKKLPHTLSPDETAQLLTFPADDILNSRDRAMFELFYSSGLRLAELAKLEPGDINFSDETVRINGKGDKTRIVPVGNKALIALQAWIIQREKFINPGEKALFLSRHGNAISARTISHRLKNRAIQQGITSNVHPHMLRHSFASHLLQSSGDLRAIQDMLGHANISTTQVYAHLDFQHLTKIYDTTHPRAKRKLDPGST
jgi:integrase/recombinase XerC